MRIVNMINESVIKDLSLPIFHAFVNFVCCSLSKSDLSIDLSERKKMIVSDLLVKMRG